MIIYEFRYNDCIHESASATISIHRTYKGAIKAMKDHKHQAKIEWIRLYQKHKPPFKFGYMGSWKVVKSNLQE